MSAIARRMTYCILLILAFAVAACAGSHPDSPLKAPGHHQDIWEDVAHLAGPSTIEMASEPSACNDGLYDPERLTG
jgi:hypothetical protein